LPHENPIELDSVNFVRTIPIEENIKEKIVKKEKEEDNISDDEQTIKICKWK
jgi:hypothetical protein